MCLFCGESNHAATFLDVSHCCFTRISNVLVLIALAFLFSLSLFLLLTVSSFFLFFLSFFEYLKLLSNNQLSNDPGTEPRTSLSERSFVLLFCCFVVLLFCCFVVLLFCCFVVLLFCCFVVLLFFVFCFLFL